MKNKKVYITCIITLIFMFFNKSYYFCFASDSSSSIIRKVATSIAKTPYDIISNNWIQKWGSTGLFLYSQYEEATADGVNFGGRYGATKDKWHLYKNRSKFALMSSMMLKGLSLGQGNVNIQTVGKRFIFEALAAWVTWHWRYRYVRYETPFIFDAYANRHIIYIPNTVSDGYIGLEGNEVLTFDLLRIIGGLYGLWKY